MWYVDSGVFELVFFYQQIGFFAPIAIIIECEEILVIASRKSRGTSRSFSAWNWSEIALVQCASCIHLNHFSFNSNDALKVFKIRTQRQKAKKIIWSRFSADVDDQKLIIIMRRHRCRAPVPSSTLSESFVIHYCCCRENQNNFSHILLNIFSITSWSSPFAQMYHSSKINSNEFI